jgi:hypothetical protein
MMEQIKQGRIAEFLKSQATIGLKFLMVVAFILLTVFLITIVYEITAQQYRIRYYVATEAKILKSKVQKYSKRRIIITRWGAGTSKWLYKPQVEYSYVVAGRQYTSNRVTMINPNHTDETWAKEIVTKYHSGLTTTAYYNPKNPQKSFLIYEAAFWPYSSALYGYALLCVCAAIYTAIRKIYRKPGMPGQISKNCYMLRPDNIKKTFKKAAVVCFLYYSVGIALGMLYFSIADKPYQLFPRIMYGIYFILGLIPIYYFGYDAWRSRNFQSPEILIDQQRLQPGGKIKIRITQKFKRAEQLVDTEVALVCTTYYKSKDKRGKDYIRSQDNIIRKAILCKDKFLMDRDLLKFEDDILIPQHVHKSGFSEKGEFPFYRWYFRITNTPVHGSTYTTKYFVDCE